MNKKKPINKEMQEIMQYLYMLEATTVGYETYCKSIGKFEEATAFVENFLKEIDKAMAKSEKDGEA